MTDKNLKARPTTYKGIEMRSRLEAGFAAWLDERGIEWQYEPKAFASEAGQYLPDFRVTVVHREKEHSGYVEIKPFAPDKAETLTELIRQQEEFPNISHLARQMGVILDSEPDALPLLIWPGLEAEGRGGMTVLMLRPLAGSSVNVFLPMTVLRAWSPALHLGQVEWVLPWGDEYWKVR